MAGNAVTIQEVLESALAPFGSDAVTMLAKQVERMSTQLSVFDLATKAIQTSAQPAAKASPSEGREASVLPVLAGLGSGLGLTPLILGIASLFGGGESNSPPPLLEFALPEPVRVNAGVSERIAGGPFLVDHEQGGSPRARTALTPQTNVTVQVQALDSRSFLDRSQDIAMAVRQAMLESSVLNDVIREV